MSQEKGVLYIATGDTHRSEAEKSAKRLQDLDLPYGASLVTDENPSQSNLFENIILLSDPEYGFADKPAGMRHTPYDQTLYLDSDTYVVTSNGVQDLFETLNHCDLCGVLDSARSLETLPDNFDLPQELIDIPNTFTWINTGVLAFNTAEVSNLLSDWVEYHERLLQRNDHDDAYGRGLTDQAAFRWSLFANDISFQVAPPEYNFRPPYPTSVHDEVHIIHGNCKNMKKISNIVNRNKQEYRQFLPKRWTKDDSISSTDTYNLILYLLGRITRVIG